MRGCRELAPCRGRGCPVDTSQPQAEKRRPSRQARPGASSPEQVRAAAREGGSPGRKQRWKEGGKMIEGERDRADLFLDKYRELEEELNRKYGPEEKSFGSPVVRFINDKEGRDYRERLDICREIRNFLSHHSEFGGERIIQPSESLIRFLDEVTDYLRQPPKALSCATLFADILKTTRSQKAQTVMKKMERQGFSHVPIISGGECIGVFSVSTVFTYAMANGMTSLRDDMIIADFDDCTPVDRHTTERFCFMGRDATIFDVKNEFEKKNRGSKRLAAVFITDNGSSRGRILGMLTSNDIINF